MAVADGDGPRRTTVIALVASAGGLEALSAVLRAFPADLPAAVAVAQHLGGHGSVLADILARRCGLPVAWARTGVPLAPGRVTVCPPRSHLVVRPDLTCAVTPRGPGGGGAGEDARTLDTVLRSLAGSVGGDAAGVVLTGMGRDGARGARALHDAGGLVIVQSPDTAAHRGMPQAAVEEGGADLVLPLPEIGPALLDAVLGRRPPGPGRPGTAPAPSG